MFALHEQVNMIELSQGATPARRGMLPGMKGTPFLIRLCDVFALHEQVKVIEIKLFKGAMPARRGMLSLMKGTPFLICHSRVSAFMSRSR